MLHIPSSCGNISEKVKEGVFLEKIMTVAQVIAPIFLAVFLGIFVRQKEVFTSEEIQGLQKFVVKICLPCLLFRSCLTADLGTQTLTSMIMLVPFLLASTIWGFARGRRHFPHHNLPMLMCCKESGMIGIPLFMILFGAENAYYMGILDLAQAVIGFPVIGILSAAEGKTASVKDILKEMLRSPLILLSALGVVLNLAGVWKWLQAVGAGPVVTESLGFLSQPVSMVMLFCVGYYFSLNRESCGPVLKISGIHFGYFVLVGIVLQVLMRILPGMDDLTRWAMRFYCLLPASYLAPGLGRSEQDYTIASGVCSVLTLICLASFACLAAIVA